MWGAVVVACGVTAGLGYAVVDALGATGAPAAAVAAGGLLAMLTDSLMPYAFDHGGSYAGSGGWWVRGVDGIQLITHVTASLFWRPLALWSGDRAGSRWSMPACCTTNHRTGDYLARTPPVDQYGASFQARQTSAGPRRARGAPLNGACGVATTL
jgi:hypothetical protein